MDIMFVLDSSGIIRSNLDFNDSGYLTSSSVLSELSDPRTRDSVDYGIRIGKISIKEPGREYRRMVEDAAGRSGDLKALSEADLDVLALALEHKLPVISDDYAVQNVASHIGVGFKSTFHEGIKEKVEWKFACQGCGRSYDSSVKSCG
ncbi:MAG: hypothetical protein NTU61_06270, partial [Candidatus Altiarchaeota archaeon]|nr:hypothetical protein [Candidatus Altiarchaeota archaeon]